MARKSISCWLRVGVLVATPETTTTGRARGVIVGRRRAKALLTAAHAHHRYGKEERYKEKEANCRLVYNDFFSDEERWETYIEMIETAKTTFSKRQARRRLGK